MMQVYNVAVVHKEGEGNLSPEEGVKKMKKPKKHFSWI